MRSRPLLKSSVLIGCLLLAACGGGADSSTATGPTATSTVAATDPVVTDAPTTVASTAPPTTLPPLLDLTTLPGLLAVNATSCAPEAYTPQENVENAIICTLNPDGTDVKVVSLPGEYPDGLALTRDGTHLWYGDPYTQSGYVIDLTTGEHRERQRYEPFRPGVSPDGQLALFVDSNTFALTIAHVDGSAFPDGNTSQVVTDDANIYVDAFQTWAPDSVRFAYLTTNDGLGGNLGYCPEVWVGAIDGTPPVRVTHFGDNADGPEGCAESVSWSPTDDRILLHMVSAEFLVTNLYVIDADGNNLTALTHGLADADPNDSYYAAAGSSLGGDWSPDGKYIVFVVGDGTAYHLAVMNADGSQVTPITAAPLGIATSFVAIRWSLG